MAEVGLWIRSEAGETFLIKKDGSLVAGVSLVERTLTAIAGLQQMQIIQKSIDSFIINIVVDSNYTEASKKSLLREFNNVFGNDIHVSLVPKEDISQEASGKYRFAKCEIQYW